MSAVEVDRLLGEPTERHVVAADERGEHGGVEGALDTGRFARRSGGSPRRDRGRWRRAEHRVERLVESPERIVLFDQGGPQRGADVPTVGQVDGRERFDGVDHLAGGHVEPCGAQPLGEVHDVVDHRRRGEDSFIGAPIVALVLLPA